MKYISVVILIMCTVLVLRQHSNIALEMAADHYRKHILVRFRPALFSMLKHSNTSVVVAVLFSETAVKLLVSEQRLFVMHSQSVKVLKEFCIGCF